MTDTIVALAGAALIIWWMSSGTSQVRSIEPLIDQLIAIAKPYLEVDADQRLKKDSWIIGNMKRPVEIWKQVRKFRATFAELTRERMVAHITTDIVELVNDIKRMEKIYNVARVQSTHDQYIDGPFAFDSLEEMSPIGRFISINYTIVRMWGDFCKQVLERLPGETAESVIILFAPVVDALGK